MKIVAIYTRKSKQTEKGESIDTQIKLCEDYVKRIFIGEELKTILYNEGEGVSGGDSERKKFNELITDAKNEKYNVLICYRLDRVARSVADFSDLIEELNNNNISFISVKEQFDTTTPMGRAMMYIASVFAQLEREISAERITDNMRELAKSGRWLGGTTPTGYKSTSYEVMNIKEYNENNEVETKLKKAYMLQEIEEEMIIIKTIFQKYLEFKSLTAIEAYLVNNNLKTKTQKNFSRFALKAILTNPVYAKNDKDMYHYFINNGVEIYFGESEFDGLSGIMAYNKTHQIKHKARKRKDITEWIVAVGKHKGVINGKDWIKVQSLLNVNKNKAYRMPRKNEALLTGLITCKECGSSMRPRLYANRKDEDGNIRFFYGCILKEKSKSQKCKGQNIDGNKLDKLLIKKIKELMAPNEKICTELKKIINSKVKVMDENEEYVLLKTKYNKNQKILDGLIQKIKYIDIELIDDINKEVKNIKEENIKIQEKLKEFNKEREVDKLEIDVAKIVLDIIERHFEQFDTLDMLEKKALLRVIINSVQGNGDRVEVNLLTDKTSDFFNTTLLP